MATCAIHVYVMALGRFVEFPIAPCDTFLSLKSSVVRMIKQQKPVASTRSNHVSAAFLSMQLYYFSMVRTDKSPLFPKDSDNVIRLLMREEAAFAGAIVVLCTHCFQRAITTALPPGVGMVGGAGGNEARRMMSGDSRVERYNRYYAGLEGSTVSGCVEWMSPAVQSEGCMTLYCDFPGLKMSETSLAESMFWELCNGAVAQGRLQKKTMNLKRQEYWKEEYFVLDWNRLWMFVPGIGVGQYASASSTQLDRDMCLPSFYELDGRETVSVIESTVFSVTFIPPGSDCGSGIIGYGDNRGDEEEVAIGMGTGLGMEVAQTVTFKARTTQEANMWLKAIHSVVTSINPDGCDVQLLYLQQQKQYGRGEQSSFRNISRSFSFSGRRSVTNNNNNNNNNFPALANQTGLIPSIIGEVGFGHTEEPKSSSSSIGYGVNNFGKGDDEEIFSTDNDILFGIETSIAMTEEDTFQGDVKRLAATSTFEGMLKNRYLRGFFQKFLMRNCVEESLLFWQYAEDYRRGHPLSPATPFPFDELTTHTPTTTTATNAITSNSWTATSTGASANLKQHYPEKEQQQQQQQQQRLNKRRSLTALQEEERKDLVRTWATVIYDSFIQYEAPFQIYYCSGSESNKIKCAISSNDDNINNEGVINERGKSAGGVEPGAEYAGIPPHDLFLPTQIDTLKFLRNRQYPEFLIEPNYRRLLIASLHATDRSNQRMNLLATVLRSDAEPDSALGLLYDIEDPSSERLSDLSPADNSRQQKQKLKQQQQQQQQQQAMGSGRSIFQLFSRTVAAAPPPVPAAVAAAVTKQEESTAYKKQASFTIWGSNPDPQSFKHHQHMSLHHNYAGRRLPFHTKNLILTWRRAMFHTPLTSKRGASSRRVSISSATRYEQMAARNSDSAPGSNISSVNSLSDSSSSSSLANPTAAATGSNALSVALDRAKARAGRTPHSSSSTAINNNNSNSGSSSMGAGTNKNGLLSNGRSMGGGGGGGGAAAARRAGKKLVVKWLPEWWWEFVDLEDSVLDHAESINNNNAAGETAAATITAPTTVVSVGNRARLSSGESSDNSRSGRKSGSGEGSKSSFSSSSSWLQTSASVRKAYPAWILQDAAEVLRQLRAQSKAKIMSHRRSSFRLSAFTENTVAAASKQSAVAAVSVRGASTLNSASWIKNHLHLQPILDALNVKKAAARTASMGGGIDGQQGKSQQIVAFAPYKINIFGKIFEYESMSEMPQFIAEIVRQRNKILRTTPFFAYQPFSYLAAIPNGVGLVLLSGVVTCRYFKRRRRRSSTAYTNTTTTNTTTKSARNFAAASTTASGTSAAAAAPQVFGSSNIITSAAAAGRGGGGSGSGGGSRSTDADVPISGDKRRTVGREAPSSELSTDTDTRIDTSRGRSIPNQEQELREQSKERIDGEEERSSSNSNDEQYQVELPQHPSENATQIPFSTTVLTSSSSKPDSSNSSSSTSGSQETIAVSSSGSKCTNSSGSGGGSSRINREGHVRAASLGDGVVAQQGRTEEAREGGCISNGGASPARSSGTLPADGVNGMISFSGKDSAIETEARIEREGDKQSNGAAVASRVPTTKSNSGNSNSSSSSGNGKNVGEEVIYEGNGSERRRARERAVSASLVEGAASSSSFKITNNNNNNSSSSSRNNINININNYYMSNGTSASSSAAAVTVAAVAVGSDPLMSVAFVSVTLGCAVLTLLPPSKGLPVTRLRLDSVTKIAPSRSELGCIEVFDSLGLCVQLTPEGVDEDDTRTCAQKWLRTLSACSPPSVQVVHIIKAGYLLKRGRINTAFRGRWFVLTSDLKLRYYKDDVYGCVFKGEIDLRTADAVFKSSDYASSPIPVSSPSSSQHSPYTPRTPHTPSSAHSASTSVAQSSSASAAATASASSASSLYFSATKLSLGSTAMERVREITIVEHGRVGASSGAEGRGEGGGAHNNPNGDVNSSSSSSSNAGDAEDDGSDRVWTLQAATSEEADAWVSVILQLISCRDLASHNFLASPSHSPSYSPTAAHSPTPVSTPTRDQSPATPSATPSAALFPPHKNFSASYSATSFSTNNDNSSSNSNSSSSNGTSANNNGSASSYREEMGDDGGVLR